MSKINILSSKIYNRIAAGEVVERPASVVKELVENSIDARANNITIEIIEGGISSIKITDDGVGIEKEDLPKALLPHATSKISTLEDLDKIETLGFRGEALASIASVSKISIASKPKNQENGACISSDGGDNFEIEDYPISKGTSITVKNLFFNTPAREKFLKTPRSEEGEITSTVSKFILGNPDIAFKYIVDGKEVLQSYGDSFESAFLCVYGPNVMQNCHYIESARNGIYLRGYVGKQTFTKPNRTHQTTFLNGRYVQNKTILSAIQNAYMPYLMKKMHAFFVLDISMPSEFVDCNVHPNKIDVRFVNNQVVYGSIFSIMAEELDGRREAVEITAEQAEEYKKKYQMNDIYFVAPGVKNPIFNETYKFDKLIFEDSGNKDLLSSNSNSKQEENKVPVDDVFEQNKAYLKSLDEQEKIKRSNSYQTEIKFEKELKLIGQALNTYLILEDGEDLYLIDQHAAHERILYDRLNKQISRNKIETQPMLLPYVFDVTPEESEFLQKHLDAFNDMGISLVEFGGNTYKISSIPVCLQNIDFRLFVSALLSDLNALKTINITDILKEKIAQKACKSAIKAGDKLSGEDIEYLLGMLKGDLGLKCPHGRPISVKISRTEIDKWFKRIV